MGNQETCCLQSNNDQPNQINIKKTIIHPIKYGYRHSSSNQKGIDEFSFKSKAIFSGKSSLNQQSKINGIAHKQTKFISTSQHKTQPIVVQEPNVQNFQISKTKIQHQSLQNKQSINQNQIIVRVQPEEQQITIRLHPNVSKSINLLKPFQKQLQIIDDNKVKKLRINHGKDIYKGQIDENEHFYGIGMIVKYNGNTLLGNFNNGLVQGQSFLFFIDGSYYKGKMKDNLANDQLGFFYSQSFTYTGSFENNMFHGKGQQIGNNHFFQGIYQNNIKRSGLLAWELKKSIKQSLATKNSEENTLTRIQQTNLSKSDAKTSNTTEFIYVKNYKFVYEGQFDTNQLFTGKGKLKQTQGIYQGNFYKGLKHGKGQYFYVGQIKYVGEYENNYKSGYGILYSCDGTIAYEGLWKNGLPNGKGFSYDLHGKKTQGIFINGINSNILTDQ